MREFYTAALVLMLAACASSHGTKIDAADLSALKVGQTSMTDVENRFGPPTGTTITSEGITTLNYSYVPPLKSDAFPFVETVTMDDQDKKQSVMLMFNSDGTLKSYNQTIAPAARSASKQDGK